MRFCPLILAKLARGILGWIDHFCEPNPKYIRDKTQRDAEKSRNKFTFIFHTLAAIVTAHQILAGKLNPIQGSFTLISMLLVLIFLRLSSIFHPYIFKIFYHVYMAIYGPILVYNHENGIFRAWIGVQSYSIFLLFCTANTWQFIIQSALQITFLNTIYQPLMLKAVAYLTPEDFVKHLTASSNALFFLVVVIVFCSHSSLQTAYEKISDVEKKNEEVERQKTFLLGFSHELRNLINSLMGNVKLASLEDITYKARDFLQNADLCGELLLHLVNNILDTGKVEVGDLEINPTPCNIYDNMERIWGICSELIRRKNLKGKMTISKKLPKWLILDHYRLTQIFMNLVGNAVKFTERGAIDISIEWISDKEKVENECFEPYPFDQDSDTNEGLFEKNKQFSIFSKSFFVITSSSTKIPDNIPNEYYQDTQKGVLKVSICDTGCGISQTGAAKLFQKFTQVTSDSDKRKLGTGLGLFITKELCERMGGEIKVFSKEERGSCFTFCLPVTPAVEREQPLDQDLSPMRPAGPRKLRAMVVDDEHFSHNIIKNFLSRMSIDMLEGAFDGLNAYKKYIEYVEQGEAPRIVTMDLTMPVMDGKKAAQKIREFEVKRKIEPCVLIVISGNCSESEIAECIDPLGEIRANAFLKKPANIEELLRVIARHCKGKFVIPLQRNFSAPLL